jgi:hypothetical protein
VSPRNSSQRLLACLLGLMWLGQSRASPLEDYVLHCMGCHGSQAEGVPGKIPPLAHSLGYFLRSAAGRNYVLRVPGAANSALSDGQLAAVLNWLLSEFNSAEVPPGSLPFTAAELQTWRRQPLPGVLATRQSIVSTLAASGGAPVPRY